MSEFKVFLKSNDFFSLSAYILETFDATFVPSVSFDNSQGEKLRSLEQIRIHISRYSKEIAPGLSYFITSPLWSIEPMYFDLVDKNPNFKTHYQAMQRYGGPSLHFIPSFSFPRAYDGMVIIGWIADYPYYISGNFLTDKINGYRTIDRDLVLENAFKEIKKFIRKNGRLVHYSGEFTQRAYAMNEAYQAFKSGSKLVQGDSVFVAK